MFFKRNRSKDLLVFFFKSLLFIVGYNILSTSIFVIVKEEFTKNSFESEINLIIKDLKYNQSFKIQKDIY